MSTVIIITFHEKWKTLISYWLIGKTSENCLLAIEKPVQSQNSQSVGNASGKAVTLYIKKVDDFSTLQVSRLMF